MAEEEFMVVNSAEPLMMYRRAAHTPCRRPCSWERSALAAVALVNSGGRADGCAIQKQACDHVRALREQVYALMHAGQPVLVKNASLTI